MRGAAEFWVDLRRRSLPAAGYEGLDVDANLTAHAGLIGAPGDTVTLAKSSPSHLARFPGTMLEGKTPREIVERSVVNLLDMPWIEPEDLATAFVLLASPKARAITGSEFVPDAGLLTR